MFQASEVKKSPFVFGYLHTRNLTPNMDQTCSTSIHPPLRSLFSSPSEPIGTKFGTMVLQVLRSRFQFYFIILIPHMVTAPVAPWLSVLFLPSPSHFLSFSWFVSVVKCCVLPKKIKSDPEVNFYELHPIQNPAHKAVPWCTSSFIFHRKVKLDKLVLTEKRLRSGVSVIKCSCVIYLL